MSGPDRIWVTGINGKPPGRWWNETQINFSKEYVRRNRAVLAALPEVQAMIAEAVAKAFADGRAAEREACAKVAESANTPVFEIVWGPKECAAAMSAMGSIAAAIRKRGEG